MSERPKRKIEFIESYWTGGEHGPNYVWNDNHGELIRCKDCVKRGLCCIRRTDDPEWFCGDGER